MSPARKTTEEARAEEAAPSGWKEAIADLVAALKEADIGDAGQEALDGFMKKHG